MDNPCPDWLPDTCWDNVTELDKLGSFQGLGNSFEQNGRAWKHWYTASQPESSSLPGTRHLSSDPHSDFFFRRMGKFVERASKDADRAFASLRSRSIYRDVVHRQQSWTEIRRTARSRHEIGRRRFEQQNASYFCSFSRSGKQRGTKTVSSLDFCVGSYDRIATVV